MVKLQKGKGNNNKNVKLRPLFPPGELPLFGPPPVYGRRPSGPPPPPPPPPRPRPLPMGYGPPPMRMPPPLMGPPMPPHGPPIPPHPPMRRRGPPGPPRPPMPPPPPMGMPPHPMMNPLHPPPPPFLRGPPRRPLMGPPFRGRIDKMGPNRRMKPFNKTKKKKAVKKPDEGSFLCESCDRSWETAEELEEHINSHVSCSAEGCAFSAHPKLVDLHFKLQHVTGLFERIPKSSDSKEIEAWIAERKKRYPTKRRLEVVEAEKLEKIARGEVLEDPTPRPKLSSAPKDIRSKRNSTLDHERRSRKPPRNLRKRVRRAPHTFAVGGMTVVIVDGLPPDYEANKKAIMEMASTAEEIEEEKLDISEDEWEVDGAPDQNSSKGMCTVLSALCAAYDSCNSDDDGPPAEIKAVVQKAGDDSPPEKCNAEDSAVRTHRPVDVGSTKKDQPVRENVTLSRKRMRKRIVKGDTKKPCCHRPPPSSLLQKLLAKDMRKERNQILQCVRFIVENKYFDSSSD